MSTLVLFTAPSADAPDTLEGLRILAALVATGDAPRLIELGPGEGALDPDRTGEEARVALEAVASFGVTPEHLDPSALLDALGATPRLVRIGDPARRGEPPLLVVDQAALEAARKDPPAFVSTLVSAGQVIRGLD